MPRAEALRAGGRPGIITGLEPDPRKGTAVRVRVDGRAYCTVPADTARSAGLAVGQELTDQSLALLAIAADEEAARRAALGALELRPFARADLGRRLVRRGHPRDAVDAALQRLEAVGLLDDAAFALNYVEARAARGRGPLRVSRDLLAMGVPRQLVEAAVAAQWPEGVETADLPLALATRRAAQLGPLPRAVKRRRLHAYLVRRGFTGRTITAAIARVLEGP